MIASEQVLCLLGTPQQVVETLRHLGLRAGQLAEPSACEKSDQAEKAREQVAETQQEQCQRFDISDSRDDLISACEKGEVEKALELFAGLQQSGLVPDVNLCTALIRACDKGGKAETAEQSAESPHQHEEPEVTHNALISDEKGHSAEKTEELAAAQNDDLAVDSAGMEPNGACEKSEVGPRPEAPISACEGGHKADKANAEKTEELAAAQNDDLAADSAGRESNGACEKSEVGPRPEAPISACEGGHKADKAIAEKTEELAAAQNDDLAADMAGMEPNGACEKSEVGSRPEAPIGACKGGHKADKAIEVLAVMQQMGVIPDVITHNALISACGRSNKEASKAMQLFAEMKYRGLAPNVTTYNAMITKVHKLKKAMELFGDMRQRGLIADVDTFNALISACEKGHEAESAIEVFAEMQQLGVIPDEITYRSLLSACEKGGHIHEKAKELLTAHTQSELGRWAEACEKGQVEKAIELFAEMGRTPNVQTYNALIIACEEDRNKKKGMELLDEMRQLGLTPNEITYNSLTRSFEPKVARSRSEADRRKTAAYFEELIADCSRAQGLEAQ